MTEAIDDIHAIGWILIVSDLGRSVTFYRDGLGFKEGQTVQRGSEAAHNLQLESCKFKMCFLARPDFRLNLIEFAEPEAIGDGSRRPTQSLGPLQMAFSCADQDAVSARLVALGGTLVHSGMSASGKSRLVTVADPDGFRIELNSASMADIRTMFPQ